jgi:hypothetical protein
LNCVKIEIQPVFGQTLPPGEEDRITVTVSGQVPVYLYIFSAAELTLTGQSVVRSSFETCGAPCNEGLAGVTIETAGFFIGQLRGSYTGTSRSITIPLEVTVTTDPGPLEVTDEITVTSIYQDVFRYYNTDNLGLTSVTFSDGSQVRRIHARAFYNNNLITLVLPNSLLRIDLWAFRDNNLSTLVLPTSLLRIDQRAFQGNALTEITIPDEVHTIEQFAFAENTITKVSIGAKVTTIGASIFGTNTHNFVDAYSSGKSGTYELDGTTWTKQP